MSVEFMMKNFSDFQKLKNALFSQKELVVFESIRSGTIEETVKKLETSYFSTQIEKLIEEISTGEEMDSITKRLVRAYAIASKVIK
jgi:hypothetical protein